MQLHVGDELLISYGKHHVGDVVYFNHPVESWVRGTLTSINCVQKKNGFKHVIYGCKADLSTKYLPFLSDNPFLAEAYPLQEEDIYHIVESCIEPDADNTLGDLLELFHLHDATVLEQIRVRYYEDLIYTHIGSITLALNPFDFTLPHYTEDNMPKYIMEGRTVVDSPSKNLPHVWTVAHYSYWRMSSNRRNQSIIVSGDSGAGKTETAKIIVKYIGVVSTTQCCLEQKSGATEITKKVNLTSPILEAFGNAKTRRNDNSSRFGKHMKVFFNESPNGGIMEGALIEVYLLERSRIVTHAKDERGYHSFYQLLANNGDTAKSRLLSQLNLTCANDYRSTAIGGATKIDGVDDAKEFDILLCAMQFIGMTEEEISGVWNTVGAVLHLLSLQFSATTDDECCVDMNAKNVVLHVRMVKELLGLSDDTFFSELTTTTHVTRGETIVRRLRKLQALDLCEGIAKSLYEALFLWLVSRINDLIKPPKKDNQKDYLYIALLDIFGFENFSCENSFEQLCINLANETLQSHYNNIIFQRDIEECQKEGIDTEKIFFYDNQPCLDLICGVDFSAGIGLQSRVTNKASILHLLDEESLLAKGSDLTFCEKICDKYGGRLFDGKGGHPNFLRVKTDRGLFTIKHYAGDVTYNVDGFRAKNCDSTKETLKDAIRSSTIPFVASLFKEKVLGSPTASHSTVGGFFRNQLIHLMTEINVTEPHWIRCIKPHTARKPKMFNGQEVMHQMRYAGVLETIKICQNSFSVRIPFAEFLHAYKILLKPLPPSACACIHLADVDVTKFQKPFPSSTSDREAVMEILRRAGIALGAQGQAGKTKVFLKTESSHSLFYHVRAIQKGFMTVLQTAFRYIFSCQRVRLSLFLHYLKVISAALFVRSSQLYMRQLEVKKKGTFLLTYFKEFILLEICEEKARAELEEHQSATRTELLENEIKGRHFIAHVLFERKLEQDVAEQKGILDEENYFRHMIENYEEKHRQVIFDKLKLYILEEAARDERELEEAVERSLFTNSIYKQLQLSLARWYAQVAERQQSEMVEAENGCRHAIKIEEATEFDICCAIKHLTVWEMDNRASILAEELDEFNDLQSAWFSELADVEKRWLARKSINDRRELLLLQKAEFRARRDVGAIYTQATANLFEAVAEGGRIAENLTRQRMALDMEERQLLEDERLAGAREEELRRVEEVRQFARKLWRSCLDEGEILKEIKRLEKQKKAVIAAKVELTREYMLLCRRKEISKNKWKTAIAFKPPTDITDCEEYRRRQAELSASLAAIQQRLQAAETKLQEFRVKTSVRLCTRRYADVSFRPSRLLEAQGEPSDDFAAKHSYVSERGSLNLTECMNVVEDYIENCVQENNTRHDFMASKKRLEVYRREREKQKSGNLGNVAITQKSALLDLEIKHMPTPVAKKIFMPSIDHCLQRNPFKRDWTPGLPDSNGVFWIYMPNGERVPFLPTTPANSPANYVVNDIRGHL